MKFGCLEDGLPGEAEEVGADLVGRDVLRGVARHHSVERWPEGNEHDETCFLIMGSEADQRIEGLFDRTVVGPSAVESIGHLFEILSAERVDAGRFESLERISGSSPLRSPDQLDGEEVHGVIGVCHDLMRRLGIPEIAHVGVPNSGIP